MNISELQAGSENLLGNLSGKLTGQKAPGAVDAEKTSRKDKSGGQASEKPLSLDHISVSEIWKKAAKDVDVRSATPREIISLSRKLYDAKAISYDDHINLSFQPEINADSPKESKPFSHKPKDYIALWQSRQENVLRFGGDREQIEETQRIESILVYLDSLK